MRLERKHLAIAALFVAFALSALAPIRSYDAFWHLATGRWIVEHEALPETDPFAIASDRVPWINGQWLFQVALHALHRVGGFAALSWGRAVVVALIFTFAFATAARRGNWMVPLIATACGFAGAATLLDVRPATIAALCVVVALALLDRLRELPRDQERTFLVVLYAILTIVWINVHPSALLAPILAAVSFTGLAVPLASAAALFANPHVVAGVTAPLQLMSFVNSGEFVNAEWLPSHPAAFPLLYVSIAGTIALFFMSRDRRRESWRMLVFAGLAFLAVRHVRNQPLLFAALPLIVAPFRIERLPRFVAPLVAAVAIIAVAAGTPHKPGVDLTRFPVAATARVVTSGLRGNVYNPDQFGGYLIWSVYPERRVLTDGRNELYRTFIPEYAAARGDSRKWVALLRKYRIDLAVDEYRPPLPVVDARTGRTTNMPASLAYFPRRDWALIAYDHVGMAFARRAAFPPGEIARWEIKGVVPDEQGRAVTDRSAVRGRS